MAAGFAGGRAKTELLTLRQHSLCLFLSPVRVQRLRLSGFEQRYGFFKYGFRLVLPAAELSRGIEQAHGLEIVQTRVIGVQRQSFLERFGGIFAVSLPAGL